VRALIIVSNAARMKHGIDAGRANALESVSTQQTQVTYVLAASSLHKYAEAQISIWSIVLPHDSKSVFRAH
jgi:hypothetical protein